jgi:hypothetical protein
MLDDDIRLHMKWADTVAHVVGFALSEASTAAVHAADREAIGSQDSRRASSHASPATNTSTISIREMTSDKHSKRHMQ